MEGGSGFRFAPKATVGHQDANLSLCARTAPQQQRHYSITSSARASSVGGTSRPSALAVLRLITSSYLVGLLDRDVCRLPTLQNLDHKRGRSPKRFGPISAVGH